MKTLLSLLLVITFSNSTYSQFTSIPDANFEQELINLGYDTGVPDGSVPTSNINTVTSLYVSSLQIVDLTGIQDFTALTILWCTNNQLTSLDVTQNTSLTTLRCSWNQLSSINVTQNTALTALECIDNQITSLDVTQNIALTYLACVKNELTSLDVTQNTSLTTLQCQRNQLACLNIKNGNNSNVSNFNAENNPNLTCIEVDNVPFSNANWTLIDPQTSFSTSCPDPCSTVGLDEYSDSNFNIFPNPVLNQLTIDTKSEISEINIIDITGKIIMTTKENTNAINVVDLSNGIYFIKVIVDERTITKKFVKQ